MVGEQAVAGQTREKGRLLDGHEWNDEPLAAVEFHVRIRGAFCVGFFSCHLSLPFWLGGQLFRGVPPAGGLAMTLAIYNFFRPVWFAPHALHIGGYHGFLHGNQYGTRYGKPSDHGRPRPVHRF